MCRLDSLVFLETLQIRQESRGVSYFLEASAGVQLRLSPMIGCEMTQLSLKALIIMTPTPLPSSNLFFLHELTKTPASERPGSADGLMSCFRVTSGTVCHGLSCYDADGHGGIRSGESAWIVIRLTRTHRNCIVSGGAGETSVIH